MIVRKDKKYKDGYEHEVVIYEIYPEQKNKDCVHGAIKTYDGWHSRSWKINGYFMDISTPADLIEIEEGK